MYSSSIYNQQTDQHIYTHMAVTHFGQPLQSVL